MSIINCLDLAENLKKSIQDEVISLVKTHNIIPSIATILVGEDPASIIYVNKKYSEALKIGINAKIIKLPKNTTESEIINTILQLNLDHSIHAILLQLPLPEHLDKFKIINFIDPLKDVDGLTFINSGKVSSHVYDKCISPCTPSGCIRILKSVLSEDEIIGKNALIIGRSNLVGKPLADMLLNIGCTTIIAHQKTKNIEDFCKIADIICVATGKHNLINGKMLKHGCILIDIGISKINGKIVGDCDFDSCKDVAKFITPVPGGVGPMTIAYLLSNTLLCYKYQIL